MAEFVPFPTLHKVKIRLIVSDPTLVTQNHEFATLCVGYDPCGVGSYVLGQGYNRTRFRRDGKEAVGPTGTPQWEICPDYLAGLPSFETNAEQAKRRADEEKARAKAEKAKDQASG